MGVALAAAAARRGADVMLVAANVSLPTPPGVERVDVSSAAELAAACEAAFPLPRAADGRRRRRLPAPRAAEGKLVRESSSAISLELEATEDVLAALASRRVEGQTLVGFAAEHGGDFFARARGKLERKGLTRSSSTTSPIPRSASKRQERRHRDRAGRRASSCEGE